MALFYLFYNSFPGKTNSENQITWKHNPTLFAFFKTLVKMYYINISIFIVFQLIFFSHLNLQLILYALVKFYFPHSPFTLLLLNPPWHPLPLLPPPALHHERYLSNRLQPMLPSISPYHSPHSFWSTSLIHYLIPVKLFDNLMNCFNCNMYL